MIHPKCCESAKVIRLCYDTYYTESKTHFLDNKPHWAMMCWDEKYQCASSVSIAFCPFCGAPLPDIKLKKKLPEKVMTMIDGGYYCNTCDKRLNACKCKRPEEMWELDT